MYPWSNEAEQENEDDSSCATLSPSHGDSLLSEEEDSCCSSASSTVTVVSQTLDQPQADDAYSMFIKAQQLPDLLGSHWTDEMHSSYLSFMEAAFVKGLYDCEYCDVDLCGQAPHRTLMEEANSAESHLQFPFPFLEFKSYPNGYLFPKLISKSDANPWGKCSRHHGFKKSLQEADKEVASLNVGAFHKGIADPRYSQPSEQVVKPVGREEAGICRAECAGYESGKRFSQRDSDQGRNKIIKTNHCIDSSDQGG